MVCKLSGLWTQWPGRAGPEVLMPWCETLWDIWGPERLLWGSDWPVLELAGDYGRWRQASLDFLHLRCSPAQLEAVLGENARRIYRL